MENSLSLILQELQVRLNAAKDTSPNNQLSLDRETIAAGADDISQLFIDKLGNDALTLKGDISIQSNEELNTLIVQGTASENLFNVEDVKLVCIFSIVTINNIDSLTLTVLMSVPSSSNWSFSSSFPNLEYTFFNELEFVSPKFILSSRNYTDKDLGVDVKPGLSVYVKLLSMSSHLTSIRQLLDINSVQPQALHGALFEDDNRRQIELEMQLPEMNLEIAGLPYLDFIAPKISLHNNFSLDPFFNITEARIQSDVLFRDVTLPLAIWLPNNDISGWRIGLVPGRNVALTNLSNFLGAITNIDLLSILPSDFLNLQGFNLSEFVVAFDANSKQFSSLHLIIDSADEVLPQKPSVWKIIPELIELTQISSLLNITHEKAPDGRSQLFGNGSISGTFRIADKYDLIATILLPVGTGYWQLRANLNLELPDLNDFADFIGGADLKTLMPGDLGTIGGFTVSEILLTVDPTIPTLGSFSVIVFSTTDWILIPNQLVIKNIIIDIEVDAPLDTQEVTGQIKGVITIGPADVDVIVSRSASTEDWNLGIHSEFIPLPSLQNISELIDADLTSFLPNSLSSASFVISELEIDVAIGSSQISQISFILSVEFDWKFHLDDTQTLALSFTEVIVSVVRSRTELTAIIVAVFDIANVQLELIADRQDHGWQFKGITEPGQAIPIGQLVEEIAIKFNITDRVLPTTIKDLIIDSFHFSFNTQTKDFLFTCKSQFPIGTHPGDKISITVTINVKEIANNKYSKNLGGHIEIIVESLDKPLIFDLDFSKDSAAQIFIATYSHTDSIKSLNIANLLKSIVHANSELIHLIPETLEIDLKDAIFAYIKDNPATSTTPQKGRFLFGLDIGTHLNLDKLPLVGKEFSPDQKVGIDDLQLLIASKAFTLKEVNAINALLPEGVTPLPDISKNKNPSQASDSATSPNNSNHALAQGLNVTAKLNLSTSTQQTLALPVSDNNRTESPNTLPVPSTPPDQSNTTTTDNTKWFPVQKTLGPIHLERIGFQYQDKFIWFLLDAALTTAGLTLSLDGLSFGSAIDHFDPKFKLHGLGLDYKNGPLEIGGAFLQGKITFEGTEYDDYSGIAIIRTETLTLAAIGSYVQLPIGPSLFIYAVLDYPIGGPSFFFVRGLAAGFGYNRQLHIPPVDQISTFPLVEEAMGDLTGTPDLAIELAKLQQYIPPSVGNYFLAIGIRFTTFEMIDSFILVTATFGHRFELDIVGLSTLILPTPEAGNAVTPIAEIQLALRATFIPDDGFFGLSAQLTNNSFLLDRKCHLTGGFAFYSWFSGIHEGDFVLTVGGYHPHFSVPDHYPTVPRLGFNWQVDSHLNLKGSAYYALTASAIMAGCSLSATWHDGSLRAWFDTSLNFLISWKPYHYEADFHIALGASYTFDFFGTHHINVHIGADMNLWGPEFAGTAHINLHIVSFTIRFGASGRGQLQAIPWKTFDESFLPKDKDTICTINLKAGLIHQKADKDTNTSNQPTDNNDLGIVNPKTLCLTTDSVIPIQQAYLGEQAQTALDHGDANVAFNIGTMQLSNNQITSHQHITITYNGQKLTTAEVNEAFDFNPLTKNAPAALWGSQLKPSLQDKQIVPNLLTGYEIHAKRPSEEPHTAPILYNELQEAVNLVSPIHDAFNWAQLTPFIKQALEDSSVRQEINNNLRDNDIANKRATIANAMFEDIELDLNQLDANDFLSAPQIKQLSTAGA